MDYQATTPVDPRVLSYMEPYWHEAFGNPHSRDHIVGWQTAAAIDKAATSVARLIGADPDEIVFTSGATEANNLALIGLAQRAPVHRRRILVSAIEHKCVLAAVQALAARQNFVVEVIPVDHQGFICLEQLDNMLDESVLVVSIMAVNNEVGTIQDIPGIATRLVPHGIHFHCDAAQALCAMKLNRLAAYADLISLSGHKAYAPQGIGALYIRRDLQQHMSPIIHGGGQQHNLRSGTVPVPLCMGMAAAINIIASEESVAERMQLAQKRDFFVQQLQQLPFSILVNGPVGHQVRHPGNANLCFNGFNAQDILSSLQPRVAAATGAACTSGMPEHSHVLRALGLDAADAEASIRFSLGRFTTEEEIVTVIELLRDTLEALQSVA